MPEKISRDTAARRGLRLDGGGNHSRLRARGVDVIVLDHHQVSNPAPEAVALVNPQCESTFRRFGSEGKPPEGGTPNTFTELCSAGLAFKLAHALVKRGRETGLAGAAEFDLRPLAGFGGAGHDCRSGAVDRRKPDSRFRRFAAA